MRLPTAFAIAALLLLLCVPAGVAGAWDGSRGLIYLSRGAYPAAMGWYRSEAERYPDHAGPLGGLALAKCRVGRVDEAREHLEEATRIDPDEPLLLTAQACVALADGDPEQAHDLHLAAADAAEFPFHRREFAWFLMHQGRYPEARDVIQQMIDAGWEGRNTRAMLAECDLGEGDVPGAQVWIEALRVESAGPRRAFHVLTLAALADDVFTGEDVEPFPNQLSPFDSAHDLVVMRAEAVRRVGRLDEAEHEAERRKRDPLHPVSWAFLARTATEVGDLDRAADLLAEAGKRWPGHPSLALSNAMLAAARGDTATARTELTRARDLGIPAWDTPVEADLAALLEPPP